MFKYLETYGSFSSAERIADGNFVVIDMYQNKVIAYCPDQNTVGMIAYAMHVEYEYDGE